MLFFKVLALASNGVKALKLLESFPLKEFVSIPEWIKAHVYMFESDKSISCNVKLIFVESTDKKRTRLHDAGCLLLGGFVLFWRVVHAFVLCFAAWY